MRADVTEDGHSKAAPGHQSGTTLGDGVERQVEAYGMVNGAPTATAPSAAGQSDDSKSRDGVPS